MNLKLFAVIMTALCFASLYMLNLANKQVDTLKSDMANVNIIKHPSYGKGYMVHYNDSEVLFYQKDYISSLTEFDQTFALDKRGFPAFVCPELHEDNRFYFNPADFKVAQFNRHTLRHECQLTN